MIKTLLFAATALALPSAVAAKRPTPDVRMQQILQGRVAGKPVSCIMTASVTSSEIVDGRAIIYRIGSRLYVNRPRSGADALRDDDIMVNRVFGGQLCNIDRVNLVDRSSGFLRRFVVLGDFVPYTKPRSGRQV